jgi:hypothetical protein
MAGARATMATMFVYLSAPASPHIEAFAFGWYIDASILERRPYGSSKMEV